MTNYYKTVKLNNLEVIIEKAKKIIYDAGGPSQYPTVAYLDDFKSKGVDRFRQIPELVDEMHRINLLKYWKSTAVVTAWDQGLAVHQDTGESIFSLIIPIENYSDTWLVFYESSKDPEWRRIDNDSSKPSYFYYAPEFLKELTRVEVTQPIFANVKIPHGVIVNTKVVPRITISLRMTGDLYNIDQDAIASCK